MSSRFSIAAAVGFVCLLSAGVARAQLALDLTFVTGGLARPLGAVAASDGSGRVFLVQQAGEILILEGGSVSPTPFLDLSGEVTCCGGGEQGLLGLAFHPEYAVNGRLFVSYTRPPDVESVIAEYQVSAGDPNVVDPDSQRILLTIPQPFGNHNGGNLAFGPDDMLYAGVGDGGSQEDPDKRGQDLSVLLGKLLRIDVDAVDPGLEYAIPSSNPFADDPQARGEIWAYGLRNPWRFSFDRETGDLWLGDVGQNQIEEIDFQPAASTGGENYGWSLMEGSACFDPAMACNDGSLTLPVLEFDHDQGCSVTAGFRYRGTQQPELRGVFFYGDFCTGKIWGTEPRCDGAWSSRLLLDTTLKISSFGEAEDGELYVVHRATNAGELYRLVAAAGSGGADIAFSPAMLDFGNVLAGESSELVLQLANSNPGPEAVVVEELVVSDPTRFVVDVDGGPNPCGSATPCLAPGATCTVAVAFSSAETGLFSETLSLGGNFALETLPLEATSYVPCPYNDEASVKDVTVDDQQSASACRKVVVGPAVIVTADGELDLLAGEVIELAGGTSISGRLTATLDPLLAID